MSDLPEQAGADFMNSVMKFDLRDPTLPHDRVLLVEDTKFYVQSGLLTLWSDYFRVLFTSDFKEKNNSEIKLKDVSAEEFEVFLQVIYPGFFEVQASHIGSLIDLSYRFMAPNVLEICKKFVEKEFDQMDKIILFKVAEKHGIEYLKERTAKFIASHVNSFDFIKLLKLAFDYDLECLKKSLRSFIYTSKSEIKWYFCKDCVGRVEREGCTHHIEFSEPITRNSLIAENIDEIEKLSEDINKFVLRSTISYN